MKLERLLQEQRDLAAAQLAREAAMVRDCGVSCATSLMHSYEFHMLNRGILRVVAPHERFAVQARELRKLFHDVPEAVRILDQLLVILEMDET